MPAKMMLYKVATHLQFVKKKKNCYNLQNAMKQSAKNQGMPLLSTLIFSFVIEKCSHSLPPFLL